MAQAPVSPVVLVILDGWGYRKAQEGNAISIANTPVMDSLWMTYPHTLIQASGRAVGLPDGQMGNSEVGHLNLGAGRVVPQELVRISDAVEDGSLLLNPALVDVCHQVQQSQGKLHLVGLCSNGGVHSHLDHLRGLLQLARQQGITEVCIHAITDGRDTQPTEGLQALRTILGWVEELGVGQIVTVSGRYFSMDRDHRWDRVEKAYRVMTKEDVDQACSPVEILQSSYDRGITDEFIEPVRIAPGAIAANDGVIFFNFRPDRARQLTQAFVDPDFAQFERNYLHPLAFATFTQYDPTLPVLVAFEPPTFKGILGEVIADRGLLQFRTAETEKYAHVTYFFNGGLEDPFPGEDRLMVPSPMVATYDRQPAMSADTVTDGAIAAIRKGIYALIVINYANPDMVGHTGKMEATVQAIETVDRALGRLLSSISQMGGTALITADHGNAEYMYDEQGNPWTAHTTNRVPFIFVEGERRKVPGHGADVQLREEGCLADIAPTILEVLQIPKPPEMTGRSLIEPIGFELSFNRTPVRVAL